MSNRTIIDWPAWTASPPGRYVLAWEQSQLDRLVTDVFGFHALQLGLPQLDALRENRMPSRALVLDAASGASSPYRLPKGAGDGNAPHAVEPHAVGPHAVGPHAVGPHAVGPHAVGPHAVEPCAVDPCAAPVARATVWCDFLDLPFESQSIDLLVLPHALEFTHDPHHLLREAERVLVPEGRMIISGFNSLSLWGIRQSIGRMTGRPFVPAAYDLIAFARLKDWIKLLGFELDRGRFGCYRPPVDTDQWLTRYAFMEAAGDRWWPIFGATYMITAIKRVRGMRLVGPKKVKKSALAPSLAPVVSPHVHSRGERHR
jgi:SAM-dependent methyltransferase